MGRKNSGSIGGNDPYKVEVIDPVLCKGVPSEKDFKALDDLAATISEKHKENNFT